MKKLGYIIPLVILSLLAIAPGIGIGASTAQPIAVPDSPVTTVDQILNILSYVLSAAYVVFYALAVIFLLLAGFGYLTANGDPGKIKKASSKLIYGVIGVGVGLLASGVKAIIKSFLSKGG